MYVCLVMDAWMDAENKVEDYRRYIPLLNAALRGDWDSAERFFDQDPDALTAHITDGKDTALHVAIRSGRSIEFVEKLVDLMPPEALALRNSSGCTALISAALYGNTKAAVIVVEKHDTSLYIRNDQNSLPLHCAANNGHKDNLMYLLSVTKEDHPVSKPFAYPSGAQLLLQVKRKNRANNGFHRGREREGDKRNLFTSPSMASNTQSYFEDLLPIMADKLGGEGLIEEFSNGFPLLMDSDKGVITFNSLKRNATLLGL
ncbi:Calcium-binding protein PBP1 [Camellia lanceoleosa]|uniref:Calcium-binding protein PBP1 n=1 Tax=Camellia lanceoleosa TaxID=1840588 RepID=A0ACC0HXL0_9ERIC|nr:Calcium-binding protein PBP1 [Camellia lanceoleosa]